MTEKEQEEQRDVYGKQQFNVYLPPELVRELKHAAIDDRLSLSRYVQRIFQEFLERRGKERRK